MNFDIGPFSQFSDVEKAYAISQLDPFHDTPYRLEGAPSDANSDSVVMTVNQERVVSASDFGLSTAAGDKWDLHVSLLPIFQQASYYSVRQANSTHFTTGGSSDESPFCTLYPLTMWGVTNGDKTFVYDTGLPAPLGISPSVGGFFSNPSSTIQIPRVLRVIGASFEVVDETPKYYQQGSCTVYLKQSTFADMTRNLFTWTPPGYGANLTYSHASSTVATPPNDLQQVTIIPNSRTWKAHEGAYVVGRLFNVDNPFQRLETSEGLMYAPNDNTLLTNKNSFIAREALNQNYLNNTNYSDSFNRVTPYNISGAYLSGLSSQYGTYRIRSKFMYEILPDPSDSTLITLATPTIPRNPPFERLLAETLQLLPVGVQQTMNPKGEAWKFVMGAAKKAASLVRKIDRDPVLGYVTDMIPGGSAVKSVVRITDDLRTKEGRKKALKKGVQAVNKEINKKK